MGIMKTLIDKIYMVLLAALLLSAAGCSDDDDTSLALNGDTWITSFHIEDYDNFIIEQDNQARSIKVHVEDNTDVTNLIPVFTLSEGATANLESGKPVNFTMPVVVKVTNGNVFMNYTISVELENGVQKELKVTEICENYMEHYLYVSPDTYEELYGEPMDSNLSLIHI